MKIELINKKKLRADDYISVFIVISFMFFFMFFHLEALIAIAVYPFVALAVQGVLKIIIGVRGRRKQRVINLILLGIIYIVIALLWLNFILIQSSLPFHIIISLAAFPIMIAGFAGIVKGLIIDSYSIKYRVMNIFGGFITLIICLLAFSYTIKNFLFNVVLLSLTLLFNIICRAALYLSEYGLSLANFKLFLYIISDYLVNIDRDGNIVLSKYE